MRRAPTTAIRYAITVVFAAVFIAILVVLVLSPSGRLLGSASPLSGSLLILLFFGSGLAAVVCSWPLLPGRGTYRLPFVVVGLALVSVILGMAAYSSCIGREIPLWSQLYHALALFVGSVDDRFSGSDGCPAVMPPSLQVARLTAILSTGSGAIGLFAAVFSQSLQRISVMFSRRVVIVVDLDPGSAGIVADVRQQYPGSRIVFVDPAVGAMSAVVMAPRRAVLTPVDPAWLARLVSEKRSRGRLQSLYLLGDDAAGSIEFLRVVDRHARAARSSRRRRRNPDGPASRVRVVMRVDDPWHAEFQRRSFLDDAGGWAVEAISLPEVTARALIATMVDEGIVRIVIWGGGPLVLALLNEIAQLRREQSARVGAPRLWAADITVVGREAERSHRDHALLQHSYGNQPFDVRVAEAPADAEALAALLPDDAALLIDLPDDGFAGSRIATLRPRLRVFEFDRDAEALRPEPLLNRLSVFGLAWQTRPGFELDRYQRAARIVHENYVVQLELDPESPIPPSLQPWGSLDPFYRASNLRAVLATLAGAVRAGRNWVGGGDLGSSSSQHDLSGRELAVMARHEHESWMRSYLENGWRYGPERSDRKKLHPFLLDWDALSGEGRIRSARSVLEAVRLLRVLGYRSTADAAPERAVGRRYLRTGRVTARRIDEPYEWRTSRGSVLLAEAGDWILTEGSEVWSVKPQQFSESYRLLEGDAYERIGEVRAYRAPDSEFIVTLEGIAEVHPGDWVLSRSEDDVWTVTDEVFRGRYAPAD